jgi:hypothetical protein
MENNRLKLPVGIPTFEELRTDGYLYIDKTKYLVELIDTGKIYFLARPRRFGKSLTITTFDALFSGKKELFKGLYAESFLNRPDFKPSPVIRLDMSIVTTDEGIDGLKKSIKELISEQAERLNVEVTKDLSDSDMLRKLIINTANKYDRKVVILLDEYDKPYTDFVDDREMANKVREVLRNFYVQIKANDEYIRFTFITGISKFARFGVFSTLNTPLDISLMPKYAEICGYTEAEIIQYFPDYLEETANDMKISTEELVQSMRYYYNGFSFDDEAETRLYNPYSTLSFFAEKKWYNYWMDSGRSKVIALYLQNRHLTVEQFRHFPISTDFAKSPGDMDSAPPEGFLYQCGYLTLRKGTATNLALDYPNTEVLNSMSKLLTQNIVSENAYNNYQSALLTALNGKDIAKLVQIFNRLLASIPYDDYIQAFEQIVVFNDFEFPAQEWLYRSSILSFLRGCGVNVAPEIHTNMGRTDLVIFHKGVTWVIEIKVAYKGRKPSTKAKQALQQIEDKNYAKPYPEAVSVVLVIDDAKRQIKI